VARVLIAASRDWAGTGRLPFVLAEAGVLVDVLDQGGTAAAASSWVSGSIAQVGGPKAIAERACELSEAYDRVIACDDPLIQSLLASEDPRARRVLVTPRQHLEELIDKTRFSAMAERAGIPVPEWHVADSLERVFSAAEDLGSNVVVKARRGYAGLNVRFARDPEAAVRAAKRVGLPVLVERRIGGELGMMPVLYDRGRVVGAMAAHKALTISARGWSTVAELWTVDDVLRDIAHRAGAAFDIDGFVSFDLFREPDGSIHVLEINPRPVPALYLGERVGVDFGELYASVLSGQFDGVPRFARGSGRVPLFPQELQRLRRARGRWRGTAAWIRTPGALREVPWRDRGLVLHYLGRGRRS